MLKRFTNSYSYRLFDASLHRRNVLAVCAGGLLAAAQRTLSAQTTVEKIHVYKTPTCGCCGLWVDHLRAAGFVAKVTEVEDITIVRKRHRIPDLYASCHTAVAGKYAIEGHVPAAEIRTLLQSQPNAVGLAVPGMPAGSPGMEVGARIDSYEVLLIGKDGQHTTFARYPKT